MKKLVAFTSLATLGLMIVVDPAVAQDVHTVLLKVQMLQL